MHKIGRPSRNKTIALSECEKIELESPLLTDALGNINNKIIHGDSLDILSQLPEKFVDPPYNVNKIYSNSSFRQMNECDYQNWLES